MSNIHWLKTNNIFKKVNGDFSTIDSLPLGVYNVGLSLEGWYLEKYAEEFTFDYKIYGLETEFCEHVIKTFENTNGNLGIMLTGTKGTGKTVTAKLLANSFKLPIIIVKDMGANNQGMIEYFSSFNFDSILFFDEFEKNFSEKDSTILQIMDGVYNIGYRKIFLLTTNQMTVNENLVGRPSRIRYVKKFGNLDLKTVKEYLDDNLKVKEAYQDLLNYIDTLSISTIDILKSIVNEVNIHGIDGLTRAKEFFNVSTLEYHYSVYYASLNYTIFMDPANRDKYSIKNFLRDIDHHRNPIPYPDFMRDLSPEKYNEDQKKIAKNWNEYRKQNFSIDYKSVTSDYKIKNLKVGMKFDGDIIIGIDYDNNVVITQYEDYVYLNFITNSNTKPSLYNTSNNIIHIL